MKCALCHAQNAKKSRGYWSHYAFFCEACQPPAPSPQDIVEMQTIDADCNDCRHFQRGAMEKHPGLTLFRGHCLKFDLPTTAYPMWHTGRECFEHRRAAA